MTDQEHKGTPPHGDPLGVAADAAPTDIGDPASTRHGAEPGDTEVAGGAAPAGEDDEEEAPSAGASTEAGVDDAPASVTGVDDAPAAAAEPAGVPDSEREAADASERDDAADFRDRYLRAEAELQNLRKRSARQVAEASDRGVAKLAKELFTAFDHLELALQAAEQHEAGEWVKGIRLVQDELTSALARAGIQAFSPQGQEFDPNEHEAMAQQPSQEVPANTVLQVYQQGYRLNGQVLRPARVVVSSGPA